MDGKVLSELFAERRSILGHLIAMGQRQMELIAADRMGELMSLLAEKDQPLSRLSEISALLRQAAGEDAHARSWESAQLRQQCREDQDACEQLHVDLLAIEAECESALGESRNRIRSQLERMDSSRAAAASYATAEASNPTGNRLDLSSS